MGNTFIDQSENLCKKRALELFGLKEGSWDANVQALSGSCANFYVYYALLNLKDKVMGLSLDTGGHLSHGHKRGDTNVSASSAYYNFQHFKYLNDFQFDFDSIEE